LIDSWNGGTSIFFEYRCSLGYFRIVTTSDTKDGCLYIQSMDTAYIQGKTRWTDFDLQVEAVDYETEEGIPVSYILRDKKANVEIHCGMIYVSELEDFNDLIPTKTNKD